MIELNYARESGISRLPRQKVPWRGGFHRRQGVSRFLTGRADVVKLKGESA